MPGKYERVFLKAGEVIIVHKPTRIHTILGSCVAVVFHHRRTGIAGICHAQLSEKRHKTATCTDVCSVRCLEKVKNSSPLKYVACAIRYMVQEFERRGIRPHEIDVKLFGGANVLATSDDTNTIGVQNIAIAEKMLKELNLNVVSKYVGGDTGVTLYFDTDTGVVHLKKHKNKYL